MIISFGIGWWTRLNIYLVKRICIKVKNIYFRKAFNPKYYDCCVSLDIHMSYVVLFSNGVVVRDPWP